MKRSNMMMVRLDDAEEHLFRRACAAVDRKPAVLTYLLCKAYMDAYRKSDKSLGYVPTDPPEIAMVVKKPVSPKG